MARRGLLSALLCALACAPAAFPATAGVPRPPVVWSPAGSGENFTPALHRRIDRIVIHATDGGSLIGNVSWLVGERSEASAHYVISRDGRIVQLVPLHDIAWHSGNRAVNAHSIGIEEVGTVGDPAGFTGAQYRATARLVAWLVRRYDIPVDRRHVIGHAQVPDPFRPGFVGGSDHHTDPGPYWRWPPFMRLLRRDAFPNTLRVRATTLPSGSTLVGIVPWRVRTSGGAAHRVDFLVDGRLVWRDSRPPFAFAGGRGLNTTTLANGPHVLTVSASGPAGHAAQRAVVEVANHAFALTTSRLHAWQKVKGTLRVHARPRGARTTGIGLYVDGRAVSRDRTAPYTLTFDTRRVHDGRHRVSIVATSVDGRVASRRVPVVVQNDLARPKPKPKPKSKPLPPPRITAANLADGQVVAGAVAWRVHTIGPVARVTFTVDGAVLATETREPWAATWDATAAGAGPHTLQAEAFTRDGRTATRVATVTVAPAS